MNKLLIQIIRTKFKTIWIIFLVKLCLNLIGISYSQEIDYSGYTEIEAISGRSASLPCNITISGNSKDVAIILWYKGDTGIPIYTLDIRNTTSLSGSIHLPATSYKKRAYFEILKNPPTLKLDKVNEKDSGEYRCRVDYEKSPTENFLLNLTIIVPPESAYIVNTETLEKLEGLVGPLNESSDLALSCEVYGGKPKPSLTWWKDDKLMMASYEIISNELTRSDLILSNLSRAHLLSKITCKASNTLLIEPLSSSITINLNLKPSTISIEFSTKVISSGKKTELICRSSGSRPPARLYWWLDGRRLTRSRETISKDGNETLSVLSFTASHDDNGKELICRAENPLMKNISLEERVLLNIHYTPLVNIVLGAKIDRDSIREGSDVYFECIIEANPWVTEVTWIFNGSPLMSQSSSGIIISNQSLVLQKVKRENRGYYSCSALNSQGIGKSETFYLKVLFAPVCKPSIESKYGVARNEMVNITCQVEADPEDVTFSWMLNNTLETVDIRSFTSNGTTSVVSYVPRYRNSYGVLLCWGRNRVGNQIEPCIFNVIPASPPDAVHNCIILNQTSDGLGVSCLPGDSGGLTQIFFLEVYNSDIQKLHWSTASQVPSFYIQSLPSSTKFTLNIFAGNKKGRSPSMSLKTFTLNPPQKEAKKHESKESSMQPIIGILIGIIITSLLIMIGVIICIKIRSDNSLTRKSDRSRKSGGSTSCIIDGNAESRKSSSNFSKIVNSKDPYQEFNKESYDNLDSSFNIHLTKPITNKISYKDPLDRVIGSGVDPSTDVTYAELSLLSCDSGPHGTIRRRAKFEPTDYASIDYQIEANQGKITSLTGKDNRLGHGETLMMMATRNATSLGRDNSVADGCSETEVSIETPLIESLKPGYRSHDIIIRKISPNDSRIATPV